VARMTENRPEAIGDLYAIVEIYRPKLLQTGQRIFLRVERERRGMFRIASGTRVSGLLLLQVSAVRQDDLTELRGASGCKNGPSKTGSSDSRQVTRVVDVSVGEQNGVDTLGVDRKWLPVALSQLLVALVEPAVDEDPRARRAQQKAAARDGLSRAQEFQDRSTPCSTHTDPEACATDTPTVAIATTARLSVPLDGAVLHSARHSALQGRGFSACKCSIDRARLEAELGVVLGHHPLNPIQLSINTSRRDVSILVRSDPKMARPGPPKRVCSGFEEVIIDGLLTSESCLVGEWDRMSQRGRCDGDSELIVD